MVFLNISFSSCLLLLNRNACEVCVLIWCPVTLLNCSCPERSGLCQRLQAGLLSTPLSASLPAQGWPRCGNQVVSVGCRAAALGKVSTSSSVTMLAAGGLLFFFFQLPFVKLRKFLFLILPRGCFFVFLFSHERMLDAVKCFFCIY